MFTTIKHSRPSHGKSMALKHFLQFFVLCYTHAYSICIFVYCVIPEYLFGTVFLRNPMQLFPLLTAINNSCCLPHFKPLASLSFSKRARYFADIITQGSVATTLRRGGIFNDHFMANLLPSANERVFKNWSVFGHGKSMASNV